MERFIRRMKKTPISAGKQASDFGVLAGRSQCDRPKWFLPYVAVTASLTLESKRGNVHLQFGNLSGVFMNSPRGIGNDVHVAARADHHLLGEPKCLCVETVELGK